MNATIDHLPAERTHACSMSTVGGGGWNTAAVSYVFCSQLICPLLVRVVDLCGVICVVLCDVAPRHYTTLCVVPRLGVGATTAIKWPGNCSFSTVAGGRGNIASDE